MKKQLIEIIKKVYPPYLNMQRKTNRRVFENYVNIGVANAINFDFQSFKLNVLTYIETLKVGDNLYHYKFAQSQSCPNLYASVYALLTFGLLNETKRLGENQIDEWTSYFNSFQRESDGLWYDPSLENEYYDDSDWWGARHLAIHMIGAYRLLGSKPRYKIKYVERYYDTNNLRKLIDNVNWEKPISHENDIDNKIMNIGVAMQYNRDSFGDEKAENALNLLYKLLNEKVNKKTGLWGGFNLKDKHQLSRSIQFAYHIYMLYFYDNFNIDNSDKILGLALRTQNEIGGFGVMLNSSACEDIDSIELLIKLNDGSKAVESAIKRSFAWVLSNQMLDGGFVFRQDQRMWYGHDILSSEINESHLFATWFRVLSIVKIRVFFGDKNCVLSKFPGY